MTGFLEETVIEQRFLTTNEPLHLKLVKYYANEVMKEIDSEEYYVSVATADGKQVYRIILLIEKEPLIKEFFETISIEPYFVERFNKISESDSSAPEYDNVSETKDFYVVGELLEKIEPITNKGIPKSIAYLYSIITDGQTGTIDNLIRTGASLQSDETDYLTSFEIFAKLVKTVGIEITEKVFKNAKLGIIQQRNIFQQISELSENSVEMLKSLSEDAFKSAIGMMTVKKLEENEASFALTLLTELDHYDLFKVEEISNELLGGIYCDKESTSNLQEIFKTVESSPARRYVRDNRARAEGSSVSEINNPVFESLVLAMVIRKFGAEPILQAYETANREALAIIGKEEVKNSYFASLGGTRLAVIGYSSEKMGMDSDFGTALAIHGFEDNPQNWEREYS